MDNLRHKRKTGFVPASHSDFEFVSPGQENIFMVALGCKSGLVFDNPKDYEHFSRDRKLHHFIQCDEDTVNRIKGLESVLRERIDFRSTARLLNCTRKDIIETYMNLYPDRYIGRL
jgi:hypothetical protein